MSTTTNRETHTPGPWHVQDNTDQGPHDQLRVDSEYSGAVAIVCYGDVVNDEMRANASLIAAATLLTPPSTPCIPLVRNPNHVPK